MAYIVKSDFTAYSPSTVLPDAEFVELAERASDIIDVLTQHRVPHAGGLSTYDAATQIAIKKATCAQVQMMYSQGGKTTVEGWGAESDAMSSVSIGKFSYGKGGQSAQGTRGAQSGQMQTVYGIPISPLVEGALMWTGLLYRGLD